MIMSAYLIEVYINSGVEGLRLVVSFQDLSTERRANDIHAGYPPEPVNGISINKHLYVKIERRPGLTAQ